MSTDNSVFFSVGNAKLTRRILKLCSEQRLTCEEVRELQNIYGKKYAQVLLGYHVPQSVFDLVTAQIAGEDVAKRQKAAAESIHKQFTDRDLFAQIDLTYSSVCKRFKVPNKKTKDCLLVPGELLGLLKCLNELDNVDAQVEEVEDFLRATAACEHVAERLAEVQPMDGDFSESFSNEEALRLCLLFGIQHEAELTYIRVSSSVAELLSNLLDLDSLPDQLKLLEAFIADCHEKKLRADFVHQFPKASQETVDRYHNSLCEVYDSIEDVPLEIFTLEEIEELGFRCGMAVHAVVLEKEGALVRPLFTAALTEYTKTNDLTKRIEQEKMTPQCALRIANKMVKMVAHHRSKEVYKVKNLLIEMWSDYLIEGRLARMEKRECYNCNGWSKCRSCGGTGIYSQRALYEHIFRFPGEARSYSFHSYQRPKSVSEIKGADKKQFGYRFMEEERRLVLRFHFEEILQIVKSEAARLKSQSKNV